MKTKILSFILILLVCNININAQDNFAIIKDKDGYSNIRKADLKSEIIGKIEKYQIFDTDNGTEENFGMEKFAGMTFVEFFKYKKKTGCDFLQNKLNNIAGYIHNSRIQYLDKLPKLKHTFSSETKSIFKNDSIEVEMNIAPFDSKAHTYSYDSYGDIEEIDNMIAWGVFPMGNMPRTEMKSITIKFKNFTLNIPKNSIKDIFEPSIKRCVYEEEEKYCYTNVYVGLDGELYIHMQGGDGAVSYHVIWVIVDKKLKYRYVNLSAYV